VKALGRTQSIVIAVVAALVVLAGGYLGLVKPAKKSVTDLKSQAQAQESANASVQLQVSVLKNLAKQLPKEQAALAKIKTKVPDQVQLSNLLRQLVVAANQSGITLTGLTPTQPTPLTGADGISYVDLTITFTGGYPEVEQYDSALESLARTLLVKDFTLTAGSKNSGSTPTGTTSSTSTSNADNTVSAVFNGRVLVRDNTPAASATPSAAASAAPAKS
jgi:Tfp pilus assembly protein PilO